MTALHELLAYAAWDSSKTWLKQEMG